MITGGCLGDPLKRGAAALGENEMRRCAMIGIIAVLRGTLGDQEIGDALHVLPGDTEDPGDLGHGLRATRSRTQDLPARLGLADGRGDRLTVLAQPAGELVDIRDNDRDLRFGLRAGGVFPIYGSMMSL
jgi:hypothetical protein